MKDSTKCVLLGFVTGFIVAAVISFKGCDTPKPEIIETVVSDTIVVRDTVRLEVPVPQKEIVVRYDTIYGETFTRANFEAPPVFSIPIMQKTYKTDDYKAIVEGYKPNLLSMEVYPKTLIIDNTITKYRPPRWALTVGGGVGYSPKGFQPYIGVNIGYVIWSK